MCNLLNFKGFIVVIKVKGTTYYTINFITHLFVVFNLNTKNEYC